MSSSASILSDPTSLKELSKLAEIVLYRKEPLELVRSGKLMIRTKSGAITPFIPNFAQKIVLDLIEKRLKENRPVRIRLLKARQLGFSTLFQAITYAFTSRREGFHSLVIADDEDGSKELFEMNKLYHERLEDYLKPSLRKSNEIALEFDGLKSRIDIDTSRNKNAGRGSTYQIVHKSESSRFQYPKEVNLGIANAVADLPGTMIFDETTANGMNFYFDEVQNSIQGLDGFDFIFIPWFFNPDYRMPAYSGFTRSEEEQDIAAKVRKLYKHKLTDDQLAWRRFAIVHKCAGDVNLFRQEYPSDHEEAFIFSGRPRFDVETLRQLKLKSRKPIRTEGLLDIYNEIDPLAYYVMGVDTSEGKVEGDKSSVTLLNCRTFRVDAEYNGLLEPDILANYVASWGRQFNEALAIVEINNHGLATLNALKAIYRRIYYRKQFDKQANEWKEQIGWQTNLKSKPLMISNLAKALRDGLDIPSANVINELLTFIINDDGSMSASEGKHDDRVISLALAVQGYLESEAALPEERAKPAPRSVSWFERQDEYNQELEAQKAGGRVW